MRIEDKPAEEEIEEAKNMVHLMLEDLEDGGKKEREASAYFLEKSCEYKRRPYRLLGVFREISTLTEEEKKNLSDKDIEKLFKKWGLRELLEKEREIRDEVKEEKLRYIE